MYITAPLYINIIPFFTIHLKPFQLLKNNLIYFKSAKFTTTVRDLYILLITK